MPYFVEIFLLMSIVTFIFLNIFLCCILRQMCPQYTFLAIAYITGDGELIYVTIVSPFWVLISSRKYSEIYLALRKNNT